MSYKRFLSVVLIMVLTLGTYCVAFASDDIPDGYTPVYTAEDLNNIRNNLSGKYILMNNIDLSDFTQWNPIGRFDAPFVGELDGGGYSIVGFKTNDSLLGRIENATVKKLGIVDCTVAQSEETASNSTVLGAFAEHSINSVFENCFVTGSINPCVRVGVLAVMSSCSTGGLVGIARDSLFVNCYNNADILLTYDKVNIAKIGGLVGESYNSNFECCYNAGDISDKNIDNSNNSNIYEGGLVGSADESTSFNYCYFKDNLSFASGKESNNPEGTKALSNDELKSQSSYEGFDFNNIWSTKKSGYAVLDFSKIKNDTPGVHYVYLTAAEIVKVPLKNRIVFSFGSPNTPEGIKLKLTYSNEETIIAKIEKTENGYIVNGEELLDSVRVAVVEYGLLKTYLYLNDGEIQIKYSYFVIPPVFTLLKTFLGRILWF